MPMLTDPACPVVRTAAGLHQHAARRTMHKERRKPSPIEPEPLPDLALGIGHGELEDVLCQINSNGRRVHRRTPSGRALAVYANSAWHIDAVLPSRRSPSHHWGGIDISH